jgi:hypothetical protein
MFRAKGKKSMTIRTTRTTVSFLQPFKLKDLDDIQPAGDYCVHAATLRAGGAMAKQGFSLRLWLNSNRTLQPNERNYHDAGYAGNDGKRNGLGYGSRCPLIIIVLLLGVAALIKICIFPLRLGHGIGKRRAGRGRAQTLENLPLDLGRAKPPEISRSPGVQSEQKFQALRRVDVGSAAQCRDDKTEAQLNVERIKGG